MEYTYCAKLGKVYDPDKLNKKYGLDEDTPKDQKFQEDTIYFREEKEKKIEYWNEQDKASIILENFLDLYDFDALTLDLKKTRSFIETYGMPLYSNIAGNNTFLGIDFSIEYMSHDPGFFFDTLSKKSLTNFYFFLRSIVNLVVDKSLCDENMKTAETQIFKFSNMLYLLISPFMKELMGGDIAINHILEINKKNLFSTYDHIDPKMPIFKLTKFESYEEVLKNRKKDYKNASKKKKGMSSTEGECSSEDMFATTNVVDHEEKLKRVELIIKFLQVVKETPFYFDIDNQGCLINIDGHNDGFIILDDKDNGIIEEILPLFIKDYLNYLIQGYRQVVIKEPQGYVLGMQLDASGAILFGLLHTLASKKYMRKCPICGRFFYPAKNHPQQRSCSHKCSDVLYKRKIRAPKIEGVPFGKLYKNI